MTLDTLLSDFDAAVMRAQAANREELPAWAHRRAGLVAIVRALRDEMASGTAWHAINVILGDAGEKVAGGSTREDERSVEQLGATSSHATTSPATDAAPDKNWAGALQWEADCKAAHPDAAPAVCVWKMDSRIQRYRPQCNSEGVYHPAYARIVCPHCSRRVKFTEANNG
jgi:hypothetical protein